jgi:lipid-A-disaccharide synthase
MSPANSARPERVMMIAGEVSGDLHGAGVVRELKKQLPAVEIFGVGGDRMKAEGMELLFHVNSLSVMGFVEVLKHLPVIREVERTLERSLQTRRPQVVVLIDYPGFNLRFARKVRQYGVKLLYYISPQVWAWRKNRVKRMRSIDRMNVIFPFEVDLYRKEGINVEFVGHPLVERLSSVSTRDDFFRQHDLKKGVRLLGLFPGSRVQEVRGILPVMLEAVDLLRKCFPVQAAIALAPGLSREFVSSFCARYNEIVLLENATYGLMEHADAAIVTSGTATLEAGWFGTPMVVVYRTSPITYLLGKLLVTIPHIGLVNIVSGKQVVPELIQHDLTARNLVRELERMLTDETYSGRIRQDLHVIRTRLGDPGASARVAANIISLARAA